MFSIVLLLGALTLFYIWLKWNYSHWKRRNVSGPEPSFLVGNLGSIFSEHLGTSVTNWYKNYPNEPYIGYYKMLQPAILLRDPDLIKDVLITNFHSFRKIDTNINKRFDPLLATNPFFNEDDEWREARKTLAPIFSQNKLKSGFPTMSTVGIDFVKFISSFPLHTDFNAKDLSAQFTTENVIKTMFSIEPGCFNKDEDNEFLTAGKKLFAPASVTGLKNFAARVLPKWVYDLIPAPFVPTSIDEWFRNLVRINKNSRSSDLHSNDLFQTLLHIQQKHQLDETILTGHSFSLFMDGTETSSTALSYAFYELARNPQSQKKLYGEIVRTISKYDGQITYEGLHEMNYLEGVIFEATRIHPPALVLRKLCTEEYTLPKTSSQTEPVTVTPGTVLNIPVLGVQMDPKYYPNPEEFMPERFFGEEQRSRHKGTFLTWGEGPRICIGMKYAILEIKVAIAYVALNFHINISPQHKPIVIDSRALFSHPKDGLLIQFKRRYLSPLSNKSATGLATKSIATFPFCAARTKKLMDFYFRPGVILNAPINVEVVAYKKFRTVYRQFMMKLNIELCAQLNRTDHPYFRKALQNDVDGNILDPCPLRGHRCVKPHIPKHDHFPLVPVGEWRVDHILSKTINNSNEFICSWSNFFELKPTTALEF